MTSCFLEPANKLQQRHTHRDAHLTQLHQVQPPNASLIIRDARLKCPQPLRKLILGQPCFFADRPQEFKEVSLLIRIDALLHGSLCLSIRKYLFFR